MPDPSADQPPVDRREAARRMADLAASARRSEAQAAQDLIDDFLELFPLLLLQNDIRIDKIHLKGFCKQHADSAFAAARHTNQNNIRHRILLSTKNPCLFYPENHVFSREKAFFIKKQTVAAFAEGFFVENVDGGRWARANFA